MDIIKNAVCNSLKSFEEPEEFEALEAILTNKKLETLTKRLKKFDALRVKLENEGGKISDLDKLHKLLTENFNLENIELSLTQQSKLKNAVNSHGAIIDVRKNLSGGLPVYYICRIINDRYFSSLTKGIIVEDIYLSRRGYPLEKKDRFARIMYKDGRERFFCRLSQFRNRAAKVLKRSGNYSEKAVDDMLYNAGKILMAAWHEDQRPLLAINKVKAIRIKNFLYALELIYLTLCSELSYLKSICGENLLFFEKVYENKFILAYFKNIMKCGGNKLQSLTERSGELYEELSRAYAKFLGTDIPKGKNNKKAKIYQLLFANFSRLNLIGLTLTGNAELKTAKEELENISIKAIYELTGMKRRGAGS